MGFECVFDWVRKSSINSGEIVPKWGNYTKVRSARVSKNGTSWLGFAAGIVSKQSTEEGILLALNKA